MYRSPYVSRNSPLVTRYSGAHTRGFTLIELLVVIAIIGILASVTMASLGGARERARDSERISEVGQIALAAELYYDACKQYPSALAPGSANGCPSGVTFAKFMTSIPTPPEGGTYGYAAYNSNADFVVKADLETNAAALADDLDGNPGSVTCDDGTNYFYCKGS